MKRCLTKGQSVALHLHRHTWQCLHSSGCFTLGTTSSLMIMPASASPKASEGDQVDTILLLSSCWTARLRVESPSPYITVREDTVIVTLDAKQESWVDYNGLFFPSWMTSFQMLISWCEQVLTTSKWRLGEDLIKSNTCKELRINPLEKDLNKCWLFLSS